MVIILIAAHCEYDDESVLQNIKEGLEIDHSQPKE